MTLRPLTLMDMQTIREWRHEVRETLRTPYMLTAEQQEDYYNTVICNRDSRTRYWALWVDGYEVVTPPHHYRKEDHAFVGYGGIENIEWENRTGEISLLIGRPYRRQGFGAQAVGLFLEEAFQRMNLHTVHGECYYCSPAVEFWRKLITAQAGFSTDLPARKYWDGKYWDSFYFVFGRSD